MKKTINSYDFHKGFEELRPNNFSYNGRNLMLLVFAVIIRSIKTQWRRLKIIQGKK